MQTNNNTKYLSLVVLMGLIWITGCKPAVTSNQNQPELESPSTSEDKGLPNTENPTLKNIPQEFTAITKEGDGILLDIKYATKDNFTKKQIYDCPACFLRPEAAKKLVLIHQMLQEKYGYGIKVFDCFRPQPYQQRLWDIVPNPDYVTPPAKGSMHSRGLAIDLTIVDKNGNDLEMGTAYDFFGKEAHHDYKGLPADVQNNRTMLKEIMESNGFSSIRTEWWHYSLNDVSYALDSWVWNCK